MKAAIHPDYKEITVTCTLRQHVQDQLDPGT